MRIVRQYGRTQAQVVGCVLFQIDQKIAVRRGCRIGECLLNERASPGVHLFGQVGDLRRISRVLENHHVLVTGPRLFSTNFIGYQSRVGFNTRFYSSPTK